MTWTATDKVPEMVERVARALAGSAGGRMVGPGQSAATKEFGWTGDAVHIEKYVDRHWPEHVHAAGFAISVMREPTAAMGLSGGYDLANQFTDPLDVLSPDEVRVLDLDGPDDSARERLAPYAADCWRAMIDASLRESVRWVNAAT